MKATQLKRMRRELGMTCAQLGAEIGVTAALINMMERGKTNITRRTAMQLDVVRRAAVRRDHYVRAAKLTGKTIAELAAGDDEYELEEGDE